MAATVKHLKQFDKIFLGIRENADEKLAHLKSEFLDHQEWLRKAVVDTKESKDGLGLVCPATVRKAKGASSRTGAKDEADKENVDNGGQASRTKRSMKSNAKSVDNRVDIDVFDPENDAQMHEPQPKVAKPSGKVGGSKEEETGSKSLSEREKELSKLKVVELKEELQKRKLPYAGKKDELVNRLAVAMELEASQMQAKKTVEMWVGKDVSPYVGMRVRHAQGKDHRSSRGLMGTIEIIPGRGALKPEERSVSVRWDADKSDVRGPYYTGEPCDRGSGIGTEKFDLITLQEVDEEGSEQPVPVAEEADQAPEDTEKEHCVPAGETIQVQGLQDDDEPQVHRDAEHVHDEDHVAATAEEEAVDNTAKEAAEELMEVEDETQQRLPSPVTLDEQTTRESGCKRTSDGEIKDASANGGAPSPAATSSVQALQHRLNQCKQAWTQRMSTDPQSPSPARPKVLRTPVNSSAAAKTSQDDSQPEEFSRPVTRNSSSKKPAAAALATPGKEATASEKMSSSKKPRGMPAAVEPSNTLCSSAKKAAQPVGPTSQPHESVQHFRAIISRIHAERQASDFASNPSASAAKPPRASTSRMPSALVSSTAAASAKEEAAAAHASKPVTWPPPPLKVTGIKVAEGTETRSSRLTEERLSAHIKSEGKHSMLQAFTSSPAVMASGSGCSRGVAREASSESMNDGGKRALDANARQQRAAENRARMEAEMKLKAADQERRRKELENKRLEAEKIAKERRDKEALEQQQRLDAAKRRAQEDEERRVRALQEQEERKRQERERAEQQERERQQEKERQAKEQERAAAEAAAAAKKPAVPSFSGMSSKTPGASLFGALGSVFKGVLGTPGTGDAAPPAPSAPAAPSASGSSSSSVSSIKQKEPVEQGPTSIKIIESKNSDDSDSDDEDKKQPVPVWAQSPNLRRQLHRQIDVSPTPVFGECMKTCDLGAMFANHQPKRRRYDKRTSSANWGDDGGSSFMEGARFEQQVKLNIAMQDDNL